MITPKNMEEVNELIPQGAKVLYFTAGWCPDCTFIDPFLPKIEEEFPEFDFVKIDRDQFLDFASEWNIFGIPSFVVMKSDNEVARLVNKDRKTKEEITEFLRKALVENF